uniref:Uncharacterized protein n=1 Tax=Oryza punctata TaxID=4537 RepID=A0A0E0LEF7_ORYPU
MGSALVSTIAASVESLGVTGAKPDVGAPEDGDAKKPPPRNDKKRKKGAATRSSPASARTYEETRARYPLLVETVETLAAAGELGLPPSPHVRGHRLLLERVGEDDARRFERKLEVDELVEGRVELRQRRLTAALKEALVKAGGRAPKLEPIQEEEDDDADADSHGDSKRRKEEAAAAEDCGRARRQYEEMRDRYPLLVAEVEELAAGGELALPPHVPGHRRLLELVGGCDARRLEDMLKNEALMKAKTNLQCRRLTVNLISALIKAEEKHR